MEPNPQQKGPLTMPSAPSRAPKRPVDLDEAATADEAPGAKSIKTEPDETSDLRRQVKRLLATERYHDAVAACNTALAAIHVNPKATTNMLILRAAAYSALEDHVNSLRDAKVAIRTLPASPQPYMSAASALFNAGHRQKALAALTTAKGKCNVSSSSSASRHAKTLDRICELESRYTLSYLSKLPRQIFLMILTYLDLKTVVLSLTVCKVWRSEALSYAPLWTTFDLTLTIWNRKFYAKIQKRAERLAALSNNTLKTLRLPHQWPNDVPCRIGRPLFDVFRPSASTLREVSVQHRDLHLLTDRVLKHCPSLDRLWINANLPRGTIFAADLAVGRLRNARLRSAEIECPGLLTWNDGMLAILGEVEQLGNVLFYPDTYVLHHGMMASFLNASGTIQRAIFDPYEVHAVWVDDLGHSGLWEDELKHGRGPVEFPKLKSLYTSFPFSQLASAIMRCGRNLSFPALETATVCFQTREDEERFYECSPNLRRLELDPMSYYYPSERIDRLDELEGIFLEGETTHLTLSGAIARLTPKQEHDDAGNRITIACPKLKHLAICGDNELTGAELLRMVTIRYHLSRGARLERAIEMATHPSRLNNLKPIVGMSPFSSAALKASTKAQGSKRDEMTSQPEELVDPPLCCKIECLKLECCDRIDTETVSFLRKIVPKIDYTPSPL